MKFAEGLIWAPPSPVGRRVAFFEKKAPQKSKTGAHLSAAGASGVPRQSAGARPERADLYALRFVRAHRVRLPLRRVQRYFAARAERALIAHVGRHTEGLGPGGEIGVIRAFDSGRVVERRASGSG